MASVPLSLSSILTLPEARINIPQTNRSHSKYPLSLEVVNNPFWDLLCCNWFGWWRVACWRRCMTDNFWADRAVPLLAPHSFLCGWEIHGYWGITKSMPSNGCHHVKLNCISFPLFFFYKKNRLCCLFNSLSQFLRNYHCNKKSLSDKRHGNGNNLNPLLCLSQLNYLHSLRHTHTHITRPSHTISSLNGFDCLSWTFTSWVWLINLCYSTTLWPRLVALLNTTDQCNLAKYNVQVCYLGT